MAITLAQAKVNVQDDVTFAVIDELRRYSWLLDQIVFDDVVNPTGGSTLTYGYTRLITAAAAAFRAINSEYVAGQATRQRFTSDLKPLGGTFNIDRVLAALGEAATNEVTFQLQQLVIAIKVKFQTELILGDTAVDANGFDGLSKALAGSSTEYVPNSATTHYADWSPATINSVDKANDALDILDEFLSTIHPSHTGGGLGGPDDVPPGTKGILGNTASITRVRSLARRAGMYTNTKDDLGRMVERYGPWVLVDIGDRMDGSAPIIPIETRDADGAGAGGNIPNLTDLYAVSFGLDAFHGASVANSQLVRTWMPDFEHAGAVKTGEAEMGPVTMVLKNSKTCGVLRNVKIR
ncbi:major capsid protein [Amycolatopsis eburnea]|uniref:Phage major capsid protein n=1 Tax=Amycolatopsis eburnea TaxID=2267691 RepID=A0A3R9FCN2_9PSEU|nr:phage major capsid protein [Amycolatopsis eburnea]RSD22003.1 phage major capsid protein [Amycolatopsis eburnea]